MSAKEWSDLLSTVLNCSVEDTAATRYAMTKNWTLAMGVTPVAFERESDHTKSYNTFLHDVRNYVKALYDFADTAAGASARAAFESNLRGKVQQELQNAFNQGMWEFGITPGDYTDEERNAIRQLIEGQYAYISGFSLAIIRAKLDDLIYGGDANLQAMYARAGMWANRWHEAYNLGKLFGTRNQPLKWQRGATKESCSDCKMYDGRVHRAATWAKVIMPQSNELECGGYRCQCGLYPTDEKILPGLPPRPKGPKRRKKGAEVCEHAH